MKTVFLFAFFLLSVCGFTQSTYEDSVRLFQKTYVQNHEVVKGADKEQMKFYEVSKAYRVTADFKPSASTEWLSFKTSGKATQTYRLYGTISFSLNGKSCSLNVYQSQGLMSNPEYKDYLFLPFTDSTTGKETYSSGRYIDLTTKDIQMGKLALDFNKAYNPYCAYVSGVYNCPIPPKENALLVEVKAGEKAFGKAH